MVNPTRKSGVEWVVYAYPDGHKVAVIHSLYVEPTDRGKGMARKLMQKIIAEVKHKRPDLEIELDARAEDSVMTTAQLVKFYESLGFAQFDVTTTKDGTFANMRLKKN